MHSVLQECCPVKALIYQAFLYFNNRNNNKYLKNISRKITYNFDKESLMSLVAVFCCRIFSSKGGRIEEQSKRKENYTSITEYKGIL